MEREAKYCHGSKAHQERENRVGINGQLSSQHRAAAGACRLCHGPASLNISVGCLGRRSSTLRDDVEALGEFEAAGCGRCSVGRQVTAALLGRAAALAASPAQLCWYSGDAPGTAAAPSSWNRTHSQGCYFQGRWSRFSLASREAGSAVLPAVLSCPWDHPLPWPCPWGRGLAAGAAAHGAEPWAPRLRAPLCLPAA